MLTIEEHVQAGSDLGVGILKWRAGNQIAEIGSIIHHSIIKVVQDLVFHQCQALTRAKVPSIQELLVRYHDLHMSITKYYLT